jgi:cobalt-zinc-cadmium efflux system membrane fusion protein
MKNKLLLYLILLALSEFYLTGCKTKNEQTKSENTQFCLTDSMMKIIQLDEVKEGNVENELSLAGKIQAVPSKNIKIYPLISGIVKKLYVEIGDYVEEGQALAEIISSDVAEFEKELADAEANLQIAQKNLNVAKDMYESKLISEKEYINSQKELEKAQAELKRLNSIFSIYHINETGTYTLKSPISGYIITKNITAGMQIRSDNPDEMLTIADISKLWVVANVYESDMHKIKVGQKVAVQTIAYPDTVFYGQIDKIFEMLDPVTRTMKIAIELNNKNNLLKPEMYARVKVYFTDKITLPYLSQSGVIFDNGKYFAVIYKDKCNIDVREIEIERKTSDKIFVKSGIQKGEKYITKNNLLVFDAIMEN